MAKKSLESEVAVLQNEVKHLDIDVKKLIEVVERNNEIIARSKGVVYGAAIIVSVIWGGAIAIWKIFSSGD